MNPWTHKAENAERMSKAAREAAMMLPMRTHRRKLAILCARFMEREAAMYRQKEAAYVVRDAA